MKADKCDPSDGAYHTFDSDCGCRPARSFHEFNIGRISVLVGSPWLAGFSFARPDFVLTRRMVGLFSTPLLFSASVGPMEYGPIYYEEED
jgi:hypothetical protein